MHLRRLLKKKHLEKEICHKWVLKSCPDINIKHPSMIGKAQHSRFTKTALRKIVSTEVYHTLPFGIVCDNEKRI
jgi:hypothetical protein